MKWSGLLSLSLNLQMYIRLAFGPHGSFGTFDCFLGAKVAQQIALELQ